MLLIKDAILQSRQVEEDSTEELNLFVATQRGKLDIVMELIDSKKHSVTEFDEQGTTALHWAAINNHLNIAMFLLDRGAVVDQEGGMYLAF